MSGGDGLSWAGVARRHVPMNAEAAWGARAIWERQGYDLATLGFVGNRQSATGTEEARGRLQAFLDGAMRPLREAFAQAQREGWSQSSADVRTLVETEDGVIVGTPNGSYGYVYLAAWLKP